MRESRSSAPPWNDCAGSGVPAAQAGKYCGGNQGVICKKAGKLSLCRFFGFFCQILFWTGFRKGFAGE